MLKSVVTIVLGIVLFSALVHGNLLVASDIQDVNGQIAFENISCYTCEGATCNVSDVTTLPLTPCNVLGAQCVTTFNFNKTVGARGCSNLLSNEANATCISAANSYCFTCVSTQCNTAETLENFIDCYQCDSYSNSECVWNPNDTSVATVSCYQDCIVALLPKSVNDNATFETYRGCASDASSLGLTGCNDTNAGQCWSCNDTKCNSFNEPTSRLTCNFCANAVCNETFSQPCLSYRADDKCAYVLNNDSSISYLACASNFDPSTIAYMQALGILVDCNGANCNTLAAAPNVTTSTPGSCVSCSSNKDEYCATEPVLINSTKECSDVNKQCVSQITGDGYTFRGCLTDESEANFVDCYTGTNTTYCSTCNGTNCNNQIFPSNRLSCYQCNSQVESTCADSPANATICPVYHFNETCISYLSNNITYRGCSSQLSCTGDKCESCSTSACNNQNMNGSATIQLTAALLFACLLSLFYDKLQV